MSDYRAARKEVAKLIGIEPRELSYVLYKIRETGSYFSFELPKKNGGVRTIYAPYERLKGIQRKLNNKLYKIHQDYIEQNGIKPSISHGFEKNKSIITNAYQHRNKRYLVNVDISDFFPSFHFGRVRGYFNKSREFMFSEEVSTVIAQLVCHDGKLPQGAPTSPLIANLIFNIVDLRILALAKKYKLYYTRYADDLSFSTNNPAFATEYPHFLQSLTDILRKSGFEINQGKTRFIYQSSRQEVTGLTVNKKINASRKYIDQTRAMANLLYETGKFMINDNEGTISQLEGRFSFINRMDYRNNNLSYTLNDRQAKKKYIHGLNYREKQYQIFLFYKYFYNPAKPTVVTEGKTDITYLKAALKHYYDRYPGLVTKNEDNTFCFRLYFLNKTKRLNYFLGIAQDGGDTMQNIWNFYSGSNNFRNIYEFLEGKKQVKFLIERNPVILLLDNEQGNKKPLHKLINSAQINLAPKEISKHLKANLFLQTVPLVKNKNECEIEDLFDDDLLSAEINGRYFSRSSQSNPETNYSKVDFADYVMQNYESVDFCNFLPLLDSIDLIVNKNRSK